jgi:hypothetical protein
MIHVEKLETYFDFLLVVDCEVAAFAVSDVRSTFDGHRGEDSADQRRAMFPTLDSLKAQAFGGLH